MNLRLPLSAVLLAAVLAGGIGITGCSDARQRADEPRRQLKDTSFERSWDLPFDRAVVGAWLPSSATDTLLVQLDSNELVAVDAYSGHTRWMTMPLPERLRHPPSITISQKPSGRAGVTIRDVRVYAASRDSLFCFEGEGGQLVWRWEMPFAVASGPVAVGTEADLRCMLGDWNNRVQVAGIHPEKKFPYDAWQFNVLAPVTGEPVWAFDRFFVGDHGGGVSCFARERERAWNTRIGGEIRNSVAVRDRHVYAGTMDGVFGVIQRLSGQLLHRELVGGPIERSPIVFADDATGVYLWIGGNDKEVAGLSCYDVVADQLPPLEGEKTARDIVRIKRRWHVAEVGAMAASSPEHLFVTDRAKPTVVKAISRSRGTVDWTWDADGERKAEAKEQGRSQPTVRFLLDYQDPQDQNRTFYVFDDQHQVVAYRFLGPVLPGAPEGTTGSLAPETPAAGAAPAETK